MPILSSAKNKFKFIIIRVLAPAILKVLFFFVPRKKNTLLIVKNDGIGDHLLFRNYLEFLKNAEKYKHYKIYLLANRASKDLALHLDSDTVDGFYWYADGFFLKWDLVKLLFALQRLRIQTIIYPNYSRKYVADELINSINAKTKIAVDGDLINQSAALKSNGDKYYSQLISVDTVPLHEFDRNKQIFEALTGEQCQLSAPFIKKDHLNITPNKSIVIFPGASTADKKWPASSFNKLCQSIISNLNINIIAAGGKDDEKELSLIGHNFPGGKFSALPDLNLIGLCQLIGGARLLISGDTVAIHIAAALAVPAVCISKGDLYGRFVPYPSTITHNIHTVFPANYTADIKNYDQYSSFTINDIRVQDVYHIIEKVITAQALNK
ncbi:glycosyltransferase family 9 protein [Mucilaginibacter sp.]|uniref:glycosyltransferase family 9 protein n=1 Tax=Mucilaginibacter sp. TaxID=1882438 RepID=UPI003D0969DD